MSKQQKVWFITGSSRGFGRVWAEAALKRGDKVVATARDSKSLQSLVETYGDAILPLQLDVTDREAVFAAVGQANNHFGRLDVVLSNAGYGCMGAIEEVSFEEIKANYETNVFGTLSVIQAALLLLRAQKSGHIITVSSIGGVIGFPTGGLYTSTKFAVEAFSEALAGEVAGFGIKVTILEPGSFKTGFRDSAKYVPPTAEYDGVRKAVFARFKPEMSGDPAATAKPFYNWWIRTLRRSASSLGREHCKCSGKPMPAVWRHGKSGKPYRTQLTASNLLKAEP